MPATSQQDHMRHHRACKGKAHASGIGKQQLATSQPASKRVGGTGNVGASPIIAKSLAKAKKLLANSKANGATVTGNNNKTTTGNNKPGVGLQRKLSRNSTSSWDYSDSDSLNSSELEQQQQQQLMQSSTTTNGSVMQDSMIRRIDRVLDELDNASTICSSEAAASSCVSPSVKLARKSMSPLVRANSTRRSTIKKESWADSLRSTSTDGDKYKRMEEGWDDSSYVVRQPPARKCQRLIDADQQLEGDYSDAESTTRALLNRRDSGRRSVSGGRLVKRKDSFNGNNNIHRRDGRDVAGNNHNGHNNKNGSNGAAALGDVIEWEELVEIALAARRKTNDGSSYCRNYDADYLKDLDELRSNIAIPLPKVLLLLLHH
ncbi:hypothetical protein TKK_0006502 [Trichogramma kaykai]|uniref:Uncharacterized protein n=1 Tax=Trichogramma kaykai TaxID=54128 RepID=A0ABD2XCE9_9HYME